MWSHSAWLSLLPEPPKVSYQDRREARLNEKQHKDSNILGLIYLYMLGRHSARSRVTISSFSRGVSNNILRKDNYCQYLRLIHLVYIQNYIKILPKVKSGKRDSWWNRLCEEPWAHVSESQRPVYERVNPSHTGEVRGSVISFLYRWPFRIIESTPPGLTWIWPNEWWSSSISNYTRLVKTRT